MQMSGEGALLISCYYQVAGRTTKQKQENTAASQHKHSHSVELPERGIFQACIPLGFKDFSANTSLRQNVTLFLIRRVNETKTCTESTVCYRPSLQRTVKHLLASSGNNRKTCERASSCKDEPRHDPPVHEHANPGRSNLRANRRV